MNNTAGGSGGAMYKIGSNDNIIMTTTVAMSQMHWVELSIFLARTVQLV